MKALTPKQLATLKEFADMKEASAYDKKANIATLRALKERGLLSMKTGVGSMWSPKTVLQWRITNAGLAVLKTA